MSAPHLSGIAAIVKSAHPDWSPAAIKSAIMTTAYVMYDNDKPILDEKLNPAGYTDSEVEIIKHQKGVCSRGAKIAEAELNYPSIATNASAGRLVVNRTVTNVGDEMSSYTVEIDMPKGVEVTLSPTNLEFTKVKESKTFTVAKALFDGQLLDVHFTRSFYKHILGAKVTYHDIEAIDPDYYKNLKWMLENDVSDLPDLTFSMDPDEEKHILYEKTEVTDYELKPGGRNIRVTEETKQEYVDLANAEYIGYSAASPVIQWFWDVVKAFSKEDMARLLQFVTGTSKVPLEGFKALQGISGPQRFQIHKAYGAPDRLPSAHTCFNQLDLPEYASREQLEERLLLAIHEASEGFGFG
nr:unnamed protein product [Digitaria exilis]